MTSSENQSASIAALSCLNAMGGPMNDGLEMVYCKTCREFYEANCQDFGTYFCTKCRPVKSSQPLKPLDQVLMEIVGVLLEKQKQKGSHDKG
jgi:hypothetical protein